MGLSNKNDITIHIILLVTAYWDSDQFLIVITVVIFFGVCICCKETNTQLTYQAVNIYHQTTDQSIKQVLSYIEMQKDHCTKTHKMVIEDSELCSLFIL